MNCGRLTTIVSLLAIALLATGLRAYHIQDRPIWFDEAFSYTLVTRFSWPEMVQRTALDVHPPFYYATLRLWTACFGTSPVAMRSLSVAMAVATVGVFYLLARDVSSGARVDPDGPQGQLGRRAGLIAALLIACSATHIHWSYEARMYTLGTALLGLSTWAMVRALRSPSRAVAWWGCYILAATAMLYTHNYALFSVAAQALFVVCYFARQDYDWLDTFADPRFRQAATAMAGVGVLYAPWVPVLLAQKARVQADYWIPAIDIWSVPNACLSLVLPLNGVQAGTPAQALATAVALAVVLLLFIWRGGEGRWLVTCMILCPVALAVFMSVASVSIVVGRHFLFAYLFLLCAVARLIAALPRVQCAVMLGLMVINSSTAVIRYQRSLRIEAAPGIRGAMEYLGVKRQPDEQIVVLHPCIYFSALYYGRDQAQTHLYLTGPEPLHYTGAPILRKSDCWNAADVDRIQGGRVWVLDTTGFAVGSGRRSAMPQGWRRLAETKAFRAVYFFEGNVTVSCYERTNEHADGRSGGRA